MIAKNRTESPISQVPIVPELETIMSEYLTESMETEVLRNDKQEFSNRLNEILDLAGIPDKSKGRQVLLAKLIGVSQKGARKWLEGEAIPSTTKNLPIIVEKFKKTGVTIEWLLTGDPAYAPDRIRARAQVESNAQWTGTIIAWDQATPPHSEEIDLPFAINHLPEGSEHSKKIQFTGITLRFSKALLAKKGVTESDAICAQVSGNSMEPVLPDGAIVGIDSGHKTIDNGQMYALYQDGQLRIKLLHQLPNAGLVMRSFNREAWPDEHYSASELHQLTIIGRVFWYAVTL